MNRKNFLIYCLVFCQIFLAAIIARGQTTLPRSWETKAVDKWDKHDVMEILQDSAWSKTIRSRPTTQTSIGTFVGDTRVGFTLRSAMVVRLADVRRLQLEQGYDSMNAEGQKKFDLANRSILECLLCDKYYIVSVTGSSQILQNVGLVKSRSKNIFLANEKGDVRRLANYSPQTGPSSEALFFFPRFNERGEPLLTKGNSKLIFRFETREQDDSVAGSIGMIEVKVQDIVREGQVIF